MKSFVRCFLLCWAVFIIINGPLLAAEEGRVVLRGVNLGAAGFAGEKLPGQHGKDYLWPTPDEVRLFAANGATVLRIPFLWERMQPELFGPLYFSEATRLDAVVRTAAALHVTVLLDLHNYGGYKGQQIGIGETPVAAFVDVWTKLAERYKDQPYVAFGLMNEPFKHKAEEWAPIAQAAVDAIRKVGANQLILVPGTSWSGAHSWLEKRGAMSNAEALDKIHDPANNFIFEMHEYFDVDSSGTHPTCVSENIGVQRLTAATDWLKRTKHKALLGEFGASTDPVCMKALEKTLKFMADHADVWYGWTYWAAASWYGDYMFNIYPLDEVKHPQAAIVKKAWMGQSVELDKK